MLMRVIIFSLLSLLGCQTSPFEEKRFNRGYQDLSLLMKNRSPQVDYFLNKGPIRVKTVKNFTIPLSLEEKVQADLFLPDQSAKAPLIIFQHGNYSSKNYHQHQAYLAASWGFVAMTVDQPNVGQWIKNGKRLKQLVDLLYRWPQLLKNQYDKDQIILAGHSFGGSAITIAAGSGAQVNGLILLDPAVVHQSVLQFIQKINVPTVLLGADPSIFKSRKRPLFFSNIKGPMLEVTLTGSTHNDAQFPSMFSWKQTLGLTHQTNEKKQRQFAAMIVAAAYSLTLKENTNFLSKALHHSSRIGIKDIKVKTIKK